MQHLHLRICVEVRPDGAKLLVHPHGDRVHGRAIEGHQCYAPLVINFHLQVMIFGGAGSRGPLHGRGQRCGERHEDFAEIVFIFDSFPELGPGEIKVYSLLSRGLENKQPRGVERYLNRPWCDPKR